MKSYDKLEDWQRNCIVEFVERGMSDSAIAKEIGTDNYTVKSYRWAVFGKPKREVFEGCDENCFECVYDDCKKPLTYF